MKLFKEHFKDVYSEWENVVTFNYVENSEKKDMVLCQIFISIFLFKFNFFFNKSDFFFIFLNYN